ncbi:hypothetical protein SBOR_9988 [Sclerotinia borealis F-4128]|uniref:Uncharacterized protein n=1 Tax=Sclerotinia borealis (strain F-4128) TaxID=1432307 RepID=W9C3X5_SCLBF|nr:hypothetical protein SBOR_9988 [Sclerotinia borealis F-4128]
MMLSSPSSFYTALDSPSSPSPTFSSMADGTNERGGSLEHPQYCQANQISSEIEEHVKIYFDELLYNHALTLLSDAFTAGISHSSATSKAACIPTHKFLQIASTLLVHPVSTTRAKHENVEVASRSIVFLRNILTEIGPKSGNLAQAFSFEARRYSRRRSHDGDSSSNSDDDDIKGVVSQNGLWRCAKDFWQIVGWSFNCSVRHPKRWRYWKILLEYLLDVLDADWQERKAMDDTTFTAKVDQTQGAELLSPGYELLQGSLLAQYIGVSSQNRNGNAVRRIVKAAFADGSVQSMKAYPEVFENEVKDIKKDLSQKRKWDDSKNIKEMGFGDYNEEEEEDITSDTSKGSEEPVQKPSKKRNTTYSSTIGDPDSIRLRQRVITLLSRVSVVLPQVFVPVADVYDLLQEFTAALPVASFSLLLNISRISPFPSEVLISLMQLICCRYLPKSTPFPHDVENSTNDSLTQPILEICYLPWSPMTSSVEDNAKYSILVENLLRLFLTGCEANHTSNLDEAIENGISAREKICKPDSRRRVDAVTKKKEEIARIFLDASSRRLRSLVDWIEICNA